MMYYNPFMPTRYLNPRASGLIVFGGGGGDPAPAPAPVPVAKTPAEIAAEKKVIDDAAAAKAAAEKAAEEAAAKKIADEKAAADKAAEEARSYSQDLMKDSSAKLRTATENLQVLRNELAQLQANPDQTDAMKSTIAAKQTQITKAQQVVVDAQAAVQVGVQAGQRDLVTRAVTDPTSLATTADVKTIDPNAAGTNIADGTGQLEGAAPTITATTVADTATATAPAEITAEGVTATTSADAVADAMEGGSRAYKKVSWADAGFTAPSPFEAVTAGMGTFHNPTTGESVTVSSGGYTAPEGWVSGPPTGSFEAKGLEAAQGEVSADATVVGATTDPTKTGVMDLTAAQGTATMVNSPAQREIQAGEIISGAADAEKAAAFNEQIQAATATPSDKATVQGQLSNLMQDFEGGTTPAWAAGAMRAATAQMAARGLGASSMAGQAIVQAAMESALPIAMADAQTQAQFESQNLSNKQQRAMLAAQQRATFMGMEFDQAFQARVQNASKISDVANMNFTAEQQVALENSRASNTMSLANLSNKQAMVMAQAASISQLESQNLSNQQQAAVQNAQAFLQMDLTNLNNNQQAEMFKAQIIAQSIFTDQAADNAAKQFNASSENQTKQFMANMQAQVSQFNASQVNANNQFNAGQENAVSQFNANIENQRDQFNAQNSLVVAQANAQWRQNLTTINTSAQNEANANAALAANAFTQSTMDQLWQRERDIMDYVYKSSEGAKDRALSVLLADKTLAEYQKVRDDDEETSKWKTLTQILMS